MNLFFEDVEVDVEIDVSLEEALADVGAGRTSRIVVYNDDHNTFEWVIQCFMEILDHSPEQSEQPPPPTIAALSGGHSHPDHRGHDYRRPIAAL